MFTTWKKNDSEKRSGKNKMANSAKAVVRRNTEEVAGRGNFDAFEAIERLAPLLSGELILHEDPAYDPARQLWNGKIDKRPAALARCENANDVIEIVRWTRANEMPLSVRGGGHALCRDRRARRRDLEDGT
jgi:FAD binding domain